MDDFFELVLLASIFFGLIASVVFGFWAIFFPASFLRLNKRADKPSGVDLSLLDKSYDIDRFVYRYHIVVGMILSIVSVCVLFMMIFNFDRHTFELHSLIGGGLGLRLIADLILGGAYFVMIFILYVACIVLIRPSALRKIERWSNRWVSSDLLGEVVNGECYRPNLWVEENPRFFGVLILVLALAMLSIIVLLGLY